MQAGAGGFSDCDPLPGAMRLRRRLFATLRREDRRHLLKQKRVHRTDLLTPAELEALERKSLPVRVWSATLMRPYQRLLCWFGLEPEQGPRGR
jgi:hypothetical protein